MKKSENFEFNLRLNALIEQTKTLKTRHASVVLYGYGTVGRLIAPMLGDALVGIVDMSATGAERFNNIPVQHPNALRTLKADCVAISVLGREKDVSNYLSTDIGWQGSVHAYDLALNKKKGGPRFTLADSRKLAPLRGRFAGKRCVIIGNGPSLNRCDLSLLNNEYTFGVNGIFYKTDEMGFRPTFYVIEDSHVVDDNLARINAYSCDYKFFPAAHKGKIRRSKNTYFFDYECGFYQRNSPSFDKPRFSFDADKAVYAGQTVTYSNMQFAAFLGFTEIYLIGVDFSYAVPKSTEIIGDTYISNEDDPNHFHPDYFGKGKKWHDPKLHKVFMNFEHAKQQLEARGVRIYNATKGGQLELFPRVDYDRVFGGAQ